MQQFTNKTQITDYPQKIKFSTRIQRKNTRN